MKKILAAASAALLIAASSAPVSTLALDGNIDTARCASRYYYDRIDDSDRGRRLKQLYNYLNDFCEKLMESDNDYQSDEYNVNLDDTTDPAWAPDFQDLDYTDFNNLINLFADDNPYFYFVKKSEAFQYIFHLLDDEKVLLASNRKEFVQKAKEYIGSYSEAADIPDLYDRARFIHDKLCLNMRYQYDGSGEPSKDFSAHSVYGPIMMKEGICEAYAKIYQLLCNYYGIDCAYIVGLAADHASDADSEKAKNNYHAWNLIDLGDDEYYLVDVTWDDLDVKGEGWSEDYDHRFFAAGSETFLLSHTHSEGLTENILDTYSPSNELPWTNISEKSYIENHPERFPKEVPAAAFVYTELPDGTLELTEYKDMDYYETAVIPEEVGGKKVTKLADGVFKKSSVKKVTLPDTVNVIPDDCFSGGKLTEINLDNITEIGDNAFKQCYSLNYTLPEGLKKIGDAAFMFISIGPEKVVIPESVESIGDSAFRGNEILAEVVFPEKSPLTVGSKAFEYCGFLTSVTLPENVTEIGDYAFGYTLSSAGLKQDGFVIRCYEGSSAHTYAVQNDIQFELLTKDEPETDPDESSESESESEPVSESESEYESESESGSEIVSGSETESISEPGSETESRPDSESTPDSSSVPDSSISKADSSTAPGQNPKTGTAAAALIGTLTVISAAAAVKKRK